MACVRSPVWKHLECSCESMCRSHRLRFHASMCPPENADCLLPLLGLGFRVPSSKGSACGSISSRLLNRLWVFMLLDCYRHEDDKYVVVAGLLKHTIPCWGYVVQERPHAGRFFSFFKHKNVPFLKVFLAISSQNQCRLTCKMALGLM